jgi:MYXO-CTERM domain-containing protein
MAVYCEPLAFNFMTAPDDDGFPDACDDFDCGPNGECALMNGNPTCRCEVGFAATATMVFDPSLGSTALQMSCLEVEGEIPAIPIVPTIGSTTVNPDDLNQGSPNDGSNDFQGGGNGSSGGCALDPEGSNPSLPAWLGLAGLVGLGFWRRRR